MSIPKSARNSFFLSLIIDPRRCGPALYIFDHHLTVTSPDQVAKVALVGGDQGSIYHEREALMDHEPVDLAQVLACVQDVTTIPLGHRVVGVGAGPQLTADVAALYLVRGPPAPFQKVTMVTSLPRSPRASSRRPAR
jgi:hypothetical protein